MTTYPNQKIATIQKSDAGKENLYTIINLEAFEQAMLNLSFVAFKIYCYVMRNQNEYSFAISKKDITEKCNISITTYHKGIKELTDGGYLVQTKGNHYNFYDIPKLQTQPKEEVLVLDKKEVVETSDAKVEALDKKKEIRYEVINMIDLGNRYEVKLESKLSNSRFDFIIYKTQMQDYGMFSKGDFLECDKADIGENIGSKHTFKKYYLDTISKVVKPTNSNFRKTDLLPKQKEAPKQAVVSDDEVPF